MLTACSADAPLESSATEIRTKIETAAVERGSAVFNLNPEATPAELPYDNPDAEPGRTLRESIASAVSRIGGSRDDARTVRVDLKSREVSVLLRDASDLNAQAKLLAPNGLAPASEGSTRKHLTPQPNPETRKERVDTSQGLRPLGGLLTQGWSYDDDDRININPTSYDSHPLYSKIGRVVTGAGISTGTMFSRQLVFAAAHALHDTSGAFVVANARFTPRHRYSPGSPQPYGSADIVQVEYPLAYFDLNCHVSYDQNVCPKYDWAVLYLNESQLSPNPGYVAFGYETVYPDHLMNAGYPACGGPYGPSCSQIMPHADTQCENWGAETWGASSSNWWPANDGWAPVMVTACDISPGNSGGGIFNANHVLLGSVVRHKCHDDYGFLADCTSANPRSSEGVRINPTLFNFLLDRRQQHP